MGAGKKPARVPVKVAERAKALAQPTKPVLVVKTNEKKAKLVAALKRLHPMD